MRVPLGFWSDISNQRTFVVELAKKLNITNQQEWYKVTKATLLRHGCGGLLQKYDGSPSKLLAAVFPEYLFLGDNVSSDIFEWDFSKFAQVPSGYWDSISNQRVFLQEVAKSLHITDREGWYKITVKALQSHGGAGLLKCKYNDSPYKLLTSIFPEYLHPC